MTHIAPKVASLAATILSVFVAGTASAQTLTASINADIRSFDPGINRDANSDAVVAHVVEGLVGFGENGQPRPVLAERMDRSQDGLVYTFSLREGVSFHNGAPLTPDEVLWSWQRYMAEENGWRCYSDFAEGGANEVVSVAETGPMEVTFTLAEPSALFPNALARLDCGQAGILHPDSVDEDGEFVAPVGTGPFIFEEWRRGEFIHLSAFDGYAAPVEATGRDGYAGDKTALVDSVRFLVIPDDNSAKAALASGDIDVWPNVSYDDVAWLRENPETEVTTSPTPAITAILLQTRDPLLKDVRLRQALSHAINFDALVHGVTRGLAKANASLVPPTSPFYSDIQARGYDYDPAKAKALLDEAGYSGEAISLMANTRYPNSYNAALIAQAMLQSNGINAELEVFEWGTQLERYLSGNYTAMSFPYSARFDPAQAFDSVMGNKDEAPRKPWDDPEAQAWNNEALATADTERRQVLFDQLQGRFLETVPFLMLYNSLDVAGYRTNVQHYQAGIFGLPRLFGVGLDG